MSGVLVQSTGFQRLNRLDKNVFGSTHIFKGSQAVHRPTLTLLHITRATSSNNNDSDNDDLLIERQLASKKKKDSSSSSKSLSSSGPKVISPIVDQVYGDSQLTPEQQAENAAVSFLGLLFLIILGEGVFLAGSGFFSESIDQFAADVVYPAFSPTVILFLVCSSLYGLWKTGGLSGEDKK